MKFADFISRESVVANLEADAKEAVVRTMVRALQVSGRVADEHGEGIIKSVMKREELGSTGIGRGIAVPHTKHASVDRPVGTVAVSSEGIDFEALDGEKVHLFFLLISPPDRPGDHLRVLEHISRQLRDDSFCKFLKQAGTAEEILQLLDEADESKFGA